MLKGIIKGGDASTYATAVYGAPEQQHAVSESNNVIAMNTVHSVQTGGDAVPAVDVTSLSPASLEAITTMKLAPEPVPMQGGAADPVPHVAQGGVAHTATHAAAAHAAAHQAGGKRARQSGGLLTDLAVPAVLLVANQAMTKRHRKSGKKSHKYRKGGAHKK